MRYFSIILVALLAASATTQQVLFNKQRSCLDHLKNGETKNGIYPIYTTTSQRVMVYCDLEYEPGSAWTLVLSHRMEYRYDSNILPFYRPLNMNLPVNNNSPNMNMYRMSLGQMQRLRTQSTYWRVTCSTAYHHVDYRDYLRAKFVDLDPLTFIGINVCKRVEYINVRGHVGIGVTVPFWQLANNEILHHDSGTASCEFGATAGHVPSEDNFGLYRFINKKFRCSASNSATSEMWFGGYIK